MKLNLIAITGIAVTSFTVANAQSVLVSGWDFSQALVGGTTAGQDVATPGLFNSNYTYGGSPISSSANWAAASVKGAVYWNGSFGSTNIVDNLDGNSDLLMTTGSNLEQNDTPSFDQFNQGPSYTKLVNTGQNSGQGGSAIDALMNINADISIVIESLAGSAQNNWFFTYAARDLNDGATVNYEYSSNGSSWTSFGSQALGTSDTGHSVDLAGVLDGASSAYLRMSFSGVGASSATGLQLDNFGFSASAVPEPSAFAAIAGVLALAFASVRRRR